MFYVVLNLSICVYVNGFNSFGLILHHKAMKWGTIHFDLISWWRANSSDRAFSGSIIVDYGKPPKIYHEGYGFFEQVTFKGCQIGRSDITTTAAVENE